jgi:hypothetical protein
VGDTHNTSFSFLRKREENAGLQVSQVAIPQKKEKKERKCSQDAWEVERVGIFATNFSSDRGKTNLQTCKPAKVQKTSHRKTKEGEQCQSQPTWQPIRASS